MLRAIVPVLFVSVALGQGPATRPADINQTPTPVNHLDTPRFGAQVASGRWVFAAVNSSVGDELWSVSSTGNAPLLVRDLNVGLAHSEPRHFVSLGGIVLFAADADGSGYELWRTDGTWAGTWMVRDIRPGPDSALTRDGSFLLYQGLVWFAADDGVSGSELWRTDGTAAGTVLAVDIEPGAAGSGPSNFTLLGPHLYFTATTAATGTELWKTVGTPATTVLVRDIDPAGSSSPEQLTAVGTRLYFTASLAGDRELWRSDGSAATTVRTLNISTTGSSDPREITPLGSVVLFTAETAANGRELWRSNGSLVGTYMVSDIVPGTGGSGPIDLVAAGSDLFFSAYTVAHGQELWKSDGTAAGTSEVVDLWPGLNSLGQIASSSPRELAVASSGHGEYVYFSANNGVTGHELWRIAATGAFANPVLVQDLSPGAPGSYPKELFVIPSANDVVMFQASDGILGEGLGRTQGTAITTSLTDLEPPRSHSVGGEFATIDGRTFFAGDDGVHGRELWVTDGTAAGTSLVADIYPGPLDSGIRALTAWNGVLFFSALGPTGGGELWRSNGLFGGTVRILDIYPGQNSSSPYEFTPFGDRLYFSALHPSYGRELWKTDGTPGGTVLAIDLEPGSTSSNPRELTPFGPWLVFVGQTQAEGVELRRSDGTAAGTTVVDLNPGPASGSTDEVTVVGDSLFFRVLATVNGLDIGSELWRSDGTPAGTTLVADLWPGAGHSIPMFLTPVEFTPGVPSLCFAATTPVHGTELFHVDGTSPVVLRDLRPGTLGSNPRGLVRVRRPLAGDLLVFAADDGSIGREPWRTDGTSAGTVPLADLIPGGAASMSLIGSWFFSLPGAQQLLFPADDGSHGMELMRYDLVTGTTTLHQDVLPGVLGSNPNRPFLYGNRLWFAATDVSGADLWVMASMAMADSYGTGCAGGSGLVPNLQATAAPFLGNAAFGYRLTNAPPNTLAFAAVDFARSNQPFGSCTLLVQPTIVTFLVVDAAGTATYPVPLPPGPAFLGVTIDCQGLVYDPPGPIAGLLSASHAIEALLGPN